MVYFFCNLAIAVFLLWLSFFVADKTGPAQNTALVNVIFFSIAKSSLMALVVLSSLFAPDRLTLFLGKIEYGFNATFMVHASFYAVLFPVNKRTPLTIVLSLLLDLLAFYIAIFSFDLVSVHSTMGVMVISSTVLSGKWGVYFPLTYYDLYMLIYEGLLPGFSILVSLMKAEYSQSKIDSQRMIINCLALGSTWLGLYLLKQASAFIPMLNTLDCAVLAFALVILYKAYSQSELWDFSLALSNAIQGALLMLLPAVIMGRLFVSLWPIYEDSPALFYCVLSIVGVVLMVASHQGAKFFLRSKYFRSSFYEENLENELASLNFDEDTSVITKAIYDIFNRNVGSSALHILIDTGEGELETAFSSSGEKVSIASNNIGFDALLNSRHPVVFRRQVSSGLIFGFAKGEILSMLDKAHSDALITLSEGRHIVGAIFLGPKLSSNVYSDYDYEVFNKLYSYFFVIGYYVRNILNQAVIGTVNREIKMSSQIISSIQENMDSINNSAYDVGYLMVPSHNIGGEFIDFIKLSETKHIFVIGDLSGKGISASMSMVILKSIIRTFLTETQDFKELMQKVNAFIHTSLPRGTIFAGLFGLFDFSDNTMYYINCAVPSLFLYTKSYNNIIEIQGEGRVLGFVNDITPYITVKKIALQPGDILCTCTDGLVQSHSIRGDEFGKDRIQQAMMENSTYPAQKMAQFIFDALMTFTKKTLEDDVSIMVLKMRA